MCRHPQRSRRLKRSLSTSASVKDGWRPRSALHSAKVRGERGSYAAVFFSQLGVVHGIRDALESESQALKLNALCWKGDGAGIAVDAGDSAWHARCWLGRMKNVKLLDGENSLGV